MSYPLYAVFGLEARDCCVLTTIPRTTTRPQRVPRSAWIQLVGLHFQLDGKQISTELHVSDVLAFVQALRSLTNRVLELCRLDEIGVSFQVNSLANQHLDDDLHVTTQAIRALMLRIPRNLLAAWVRQIHLLVEITQTSPEAVLLCSHHDCLIHPRCSGLTGLVLTVFFSSPVTFTITSVLSSKFFICFILNTSFPSCTEHPHMTSNPVAGDLVQAASDVLHGHGGKVLVVRVLSTTRDLHTDVHLELGLVLVLSLFWTSSCVCS